MGALGSKIEPSVSSVDELYDRRQRTLLLLLDAGGLSGTLGLGFLRHGDGCV